MLGDIIEIAERLWLIEGEMPQDNDRYPDIANVVAYRKEDRLYFIDTGVGPVMRASLNKLIQMNGPLREFTILHSHGHIDHICNNDLIDDIQADVKRHYLSEPGLKLLDGPSYFARHYHCLNEYYDAFAGFRAKRLKYGAVGVLRDVLAFFIGRKAALKMLIPLGTRKFEPVRPSRDTLQFFETLPRQRIPIGEAEWTGWGMGENDVLVLEDRGHSPDHMVFYIPEHDFLYTGDATFEFFSVWPDADRNTTRSTLGNCVKMAQSDQVQVLADAHHHHIYKGKQAITTFLNALLEDDQAFQKVLSGVLSDHAGLTIPEIHVCLKQLHTIPVVEKYLDREFPHAPPTLQAVILLTLLDMNCRYEGPWKKKRFYPAIPDAGVDGFRRTGGDSHFRP